MVGWDKIPGREGKEEVPGRSTGLSLHTFIFLVSETLFQRRWFPYSWNMRYTLECATGDECGTEMTVMEEVPRTEPCS